MQSKLGSFTETLINVLGGSAVAWAINRYALPLMEVYVSSSQNFLMVTLFTLASFIRQFFLRRLFNWLSDRKGF